MLYGYARVSTKDKQNFNRQIYELKKAFPNLREENIFTDKISGTKKNRPGLKALMENLKPGDHLYITELSRLSRSLEDLLELIKEFDNKGVSLHSLKESFIFESDSPYSKIILVVLAAIADLERVLIVERIKAGVESAKEKGVKFGRPAIEQKRLDEAMKLHDSGDYTVSRILEMVGISKSTFYRELRRRNLQASQ